MPAAMSNKSGQDHYKVLGVSRNFSKDDIQARYKRLALLTHPDKNPDDPYATVKMAKINEAYQVLTDSVRRYYFDVAFGYDKRPVQAEDAVPRDTNRHDDQNDGVGIKSGPKKQDKRGRVKRRGVAKMAKTEKQQWKPYTLEEKFFMLGKHHAPEDKPDPDSRPEQELHAWQRVQIAAESGTALVKGDIDHTKPTRATNKTFRCKVWPKKPKFTKHPMVPNHKINPIRLMERGRGKLKSQDARDLESKLVEANRRAWEANKDLVTLNNEKREVKLARRTQPLERKMAIYRAMGRTGAALSGKTIDKFGERIDKQRARRLQAAQAKSYKSANARISGPDAPRPGQIEGRPVPEASALVLRQQQIDAMIVAAKDMSLQARAEVQDITREMALLWSDEGATWIKDKIVAAIEEKFALSDTKYQAKLIKMEHKRPAEEALVRSLTLEMNYLRRSLETRATYASALADAGADMDAVDRCRKGRGQYQAFKRDQELFEYLSDESIARLEKIWKRQLNGAASFVPELSGKKSYVAQQKSKRHLQKYAMDEAYMNDDVLDMIPLPSDKLTGAHTYAMDAARFQDDALIEALSLRREAKTGIVAEDRILEVELGDCKHSG